MTKLFEPSETNDKNISTGGIVYPCYTRYGKSFFAVFGEDKGIHVNDHDHDRCIRYTTLDLAFINGFEIITKEEFHEKLNEVKTKITHKIELLQLAEAPRVDTTKEDDMIAEAIIEQESYDKVERDEY